ncbi:unnamed protein product [Callosobruchus maculatus]|uniref:Charged multivesicular body protein 3 n=1 Tax=Callosobruchus maculatus TaxID=64391 RepID=A0A653BY69_CALMS|nr:unnamed protein product [Callosobruchus maculatus]
MGLFGKTPERNPKDMVTEWSHKLRKEGYQIDRQIRAIQREEEKVKRTLKEAAKKNDKDTCLILAKEIINARAAMQRLVRIPEVAHTMQEMSKEMMKAGIIEEMLDDAMDEFEDTEEMEEAAQSEIDKVLYEITEGKIGEAPAPPTDATIREKQPAEEPEEEDEEELEEMQSRLAALKS